MKKGLLLTALVLVLIGTIGFLQPVATVLAGDDCPSKHEGELTSSHTFDKWTLPAGTKVKITLKALEDNTDAKILFEDSTLAEKDDMDEGDKLSASKKFNHQAWRVRFGIDVDSGSVEYTIKFECGSDEEDNSYPSLWDGVFADATSFWFIGMNGMQPVAITSLDLASFPAKPAQNTLIRMSADQRAAAYILTNGWLQMNVGPDADGKVQVVIIDKLPPTMVCGYEFTAGDPAGSERTTMPCDYSKVQ